VKRARPLSIKLTASSDCIILLPKNAIPKPKEVALVPSTVTYGPVLAALSADDWESYLLAHSNLPGPRGNLELAQVAADMGTEAQFRRWAGLGPDVAPENTPGCFLAFCGVVGLGAVMAMSRPADGIRPSEHEKRPQALTAAAEAASQFQAGGFQPLSNVLVVLHHLASDPRWRIREAVAMALQRWGDADMPGLLVAMGDWAAGNPLEQRAAAAALCEPRLLKDPEHAAGVLRILDEITTSIPQVTDRKSDAFKTLRQGLAYCWSVAVAALPDAGKPLMEKWLASPDPDIRWIMRENLRKNRLAKMDATWVSRQMTVPAPNTSEAAATD
jgi:hypothetical protein